MNRHFRVLSFDLDDTLWDFPPVLARAETDYWHWLCQHYPRVAEHGSIATLAQRREALFAEPALRNRVSSVRLRSTAELLRASGYDAHEADRGAQAAFATFLEGRHRVTLFADTEAVLAELSQHYRLIVITNGNACVRRLGLGRHFSLSLAGEHFLAGKPHHDLFHAALRATGCPPEQMIHIGDHPVYDMQPARELGLGSVWMNAGGHAWPNGPTRPDAEIRSLGELPAAIAALENARLAA